MHEVDWCLEVPVAVVRAADLICTNYERLVAQLIDLLNGEVLPVVSWGFLERNEQRAALAVHEATGMTPEHWATLDEASREPWLERTIAALAGLATPVVDTVGTTAPESGGQPADPPPPPEPEFVWLGNRRLRIGDRVVVLDPPAAAVLGALVQVKAATKPELERASKQEDPGRELRKLVRKYPELDRHITRPGGKGRGGYSTTIREGQ